jgi:prepilin peptidase CpaA
LEYWLPLIPLTIGAALDLRSREIPDWISLSILVCALVGTAAGASSHGWSTLALGFALGCLVGAGLFALVGLGGGDAKIVAALGAVLGPEALLLLLYYVALAGGLLAVVAYLRKRRDLAYGPAIALGYAALLAVSRGEL